MGGLAFALLIAGTAPYLAGYCMIEDPLTSFK
jgi:hypothetical protein